MDQIHFVIPIIVKLFKYITVLSQDLWDFIIEPWWIFIKRLCVRDKIIKYGADYFIKQEVSDDLSICVLNLESVELKSCFSRNISL